MCIHCTQAAETEVVKPVLLWLTEPGARYSDDSAAKVVRVVESWLIRRLMLRLPSADHTRVVAELIRSSRGVANADLPARVATYLQRQHAESAYWPGTRRSARRWPTNTRTAASSAVGFGFCWRP